MNEEFPSAVPELPVSDLARAAVYYERCLGKDDAAEREDARARP
jgi:hypothetical protein